LNVVNTQARRGWLTEAEISVGVYGAVRAGTAQTIIDGTIPILRRLSRFSR
jgi:hypothetical protein